MWIKWIKYLLALIVLSTWSAITLAMVPVYTNPNIVISVSKQSTYFQIVQPANPTTGYRWATPQYPSNMLQLDRSYYQAPDNNRMGASGTMHWYFHVRADAALQSGRIKLIYRQPWQPHVNSKTVIFRVNLSNTAVNIL